MPVFNADHKLIGVTVLINKKRPGEFPPYNPEDVMRSPRSVESEFQPHRHGIYEAFNIQAGVAL
jgi:adenylate cyclase